LACGSSARTIAATEVARKGMTHDIPTSVAGRVEGESDRAVLRALDAVEGWLDQAGIGSAEMWLGEHAYRVARWARPEPNTLLTHSLSTRTKE
jgi:hypothetical protein